MAKNTDRSGVVENIRRNNPPDGYLSGDRIIRSLRSGVLKVRAQTSLATTTFKDPALAGYGDDYFIGWQLQFVINNTTNSTNRSVGEQIIVTDSTDAGVLTFGALTGAMVLGDEFYLIPPYLQQEGFRYAGQSVTFAAATTGDQAEHELLTVTGKVRVRLMAVCTTNVAGSGSIQLGVGGATNFLIASTTGTDIDANDIWYAAAPATGYAFTTDAMFDFITTGVDVGYEITGNTLTGGVIWFGIWWKPLDAGSYAAAATVGAGAAI